MSKYSTSSIWTRTYTSEWGNGNYTPALISGAAHVGGSYGAGITFCRAGACGRSLSTFCRMDRKFISRWSRSKRGAQLQRRFARFVGMIVVSTYHSWTEAWLRRREQVRFKQVKWFIYRPGFLRCCVLRSRDCQPFSTWFLLLHYVASIMYHIWMRSVMCIGQVPDGGNRRRRPASVVVYLWCLTTLKSLDAWPILQNVLFSDAWYIGDRSCVCMSLINVFSIVLRVTSRPIISVR